MSGYLPPWRSRRGLAAVAAQEPAGQAADRRFPSRRRTGRRAAAAYGDSGTRRESLRDECEDGCRRGDGGRCGDRPAADDPRFSAPDEGAAARSGRRAAGPGTPRPFLSHSWRTTERAAELERLAQEGRLDAEAPKRGDEAARDFLAVCGSSQLPAVDAWLARVLAACAGHYADPAARAAAKAALPDPVQAHAALLAALARTDQPASGGNLEFVGRVARADPAAAAALAAWLTSALSRGAGLDAAEVYDLREWSSAGRPLHPRCCDE